MFWGQLFHWCICQLHPTLLSPIIPRWRTDTGSSYNFATESDIRVISSAAVMFYIENARYQCRRYLTLENRIRYKPEVATVPKTGSLQLTLFSDVGRRRFERSRTWNAQNIAVTVEIASISVSLFELLVLPVYT